MRRAVLLLALLAAACARKPAAQPPPPETPETDPCQGCAEKGGTCVDGTCVGFCTTAETSCPTDSGKQCCHDGQKCCSGLGVDGCFPGDAPCPVPCAAGGSCPLGQFCQGGACVESCAPEDRCGLNGCCSPGWACSGESCVATNLTVEVTAGSKLEVATPGPRNLLHIEAAIRNAGATDLVLGDPASSPLFTTSTCGGKALAGFLAYRIVDDTGAERSRGQIDAACVADVKPPEGSSDGPRFACGRQGLQPGWTATAPGDGACTALDVTDLAPGSYTLELRINPDRTVPESSYDDDMATTTLTIPAAGLFERPVNTSCVAPPRPPSRSPVALEDAFPDLPAFSYPVLLTQAPANPDRFYVAQLGGTVLTFPAATPSATSVFVDLTDRVWVNGDAGLVAMAFHPDFKDNGRVFLTYNTRGGTANRSIVSEFLSLDGGLTLEPGSEKVLIDLDQIEAIHDAADMHFGPDGYLYIGFGDSGPQGDPYGHAQDLHGLHGKILRIDVDHGEPYAIPGDNPFAGSDARGEIWALGLRNPWRFGFDPATGKLYAGDVGYYTTEEVDEIDRGGNYGWPMREGTGCWSVNPCNLPGLIDPLAEYPHPVGDCVTGGYVYRGASIPGFAGTYLYGDYITGLVWGLRATDVGQPEPELLLDTGQNVVAFGQDAGGEVYVVGIGGRIFKLVAAPVQGQDTFPRTLSATGCFDPADPTRAAPGLIPYGLQVGFWSDGAEKSRWMALPEGAHITAADDGDFQFPVGTVLAKEFRMAGKRVETRLFMRHDDGSWAGYSYAWRDDESDADLLDDTAVRDLPGGKTWVYPSRPQCMQCHTAAAGFALGPEVIQLDGDFTYATGRTANQLRTLEDIGVLRTPLPDGAMRPPLPPIQSHAPTEDRARAWLHANCSGCHRPGGPGQGGLDFRAGTAFADVGACGKPPTLGDLGLPRARLIAPGHPEESVVLGRMASLDRNRMPPIGSHVVDAYARTLLTEWIAGLDPYACGDCQQKTAGNKAYVVCSSHRTWAEARDRCADFGDDLLVLDDAAEADLVQAMVATQLGEDHWVGLTDAAVEGSFVRVDGKPVGYTRWAWGQPDDWQGAEDCVENWIGAAAWNDLGCGAQLAFVCEK